MKSSVYNTNRLYNMIFFAYWAVEKKTDNCPRYVYSSFSTPYANIL